MKKIFKNMFALNNLRKNATSLTLGEDELFAERVRSYPCHVRRWIWKSDWNILFISVTYLFIWFGNLYRNVIQKTYLLLSLIHISYTKSVNRSLFEYFPYPKSFRFFLEQGLFPFLT